MAIARPTRSDTRDGKGKAKGDPSGITIGSEADFAASETLETTQRRIIARPPRIPNLKRSLALIDVTCPFHSVTPVFFMTTVATIAADNAVKSGSDGGHRVFRFAQDPHLDHVAGFPIVARGGEAGGDGHPLGVFVEEKAIAHRSPPLITVNR